jgi:hypothetical protein
MVRYPSKGWTATARSSEHAIEEFGMGLGRPIEAPQARLALERRRGGKYTGRGEGCTRGDFMAGQATATMLAGHMGLGGTVVDPENLRMRECENLRISESQNLRVQHSGRWLAHFGPFWPWAYSSPAWAGTRARVCLLPRSARTRWAAARAERPEGQKEGGGGGICVSN